MHQIQGRTDLTISKDKVVLLNYTLKDKDGKVLDTCVGTEPLEYIHGNGYLIPGLERELEGKASGEKFSCVIQPEDGYGLRNEARVFSINRDRFEEGVDIQVGMMFQVQTLEGVSIVTVTSVDGDKITVDGNHSLAGQVLYFDIEIVEVREPSENELARLSLQSSLNGCGGCGGCGGGGCGGCGGGCGSCGEGDNACEGGCGNGDCNCENGCENGCGK